MQTRKLLIKKHKKQVKSVPNKHTKNVNNFIETYNIHNEEVDRRNNIKGIESTDN